MSTEKEKEKEKEKMTTEKSGMDRRAFRERLLAAWERVLRLSRRAPKRLRLCESLPLGERRFVAVVEFEQTRFLVGGTSSSLVLLSRLDDADADGTDADGADVSGTGVNGTGGNGRTVKPAETGNESTDPLWNAVSAIATRQGKTC